MSITGVFKNEGISSSGMYKDKTCSSLKTGPSFCSFTFVALCLPDLLKHVIRSLSNKPTASVSRSHSGRGGKTENNNILSTTPTIVINKITVNACTSKHSKAFSHEPEPLTKTPWRPAGTHRALGGPGPLPRNTTSRR